MYDIFKKYLEMEYGFIIVMNFPEVLEFEIQNYTPIVC